jgi:hypothetical protein
MDLLNSKDLLEYEQIVIRLNDELREKQRVTYIRRFWKDYVKFYKAHTKHNQPTEYEVSNDESIKAYWTPRKEGT